MIKSDAVVSIQVSAGFLGKIQKMMIGLISGKTTEEIDEFKKHVEEQKTNKSEFPEDWMDSLYTLTLLVTEIEKVLIKDGHTYEEEIKMEDDLIQPEN